MHAESGLWWAETPLALFCQASMSFKHGINRESPRIESVKITVQFE